MKIKFPCGHENEVGFHGRERFIACTTCGKWAGVTKYTEVVNFYEATPTTYSPPVNAPETK